MEQKEKIEEFILTEVCPDAGLTEISEDEELVDSGIVDSLGVLKILSFLDDEFGVDLSDEEIRPEKFSSIKLIIELING